MKEEKKEKKAVAKVELPNFESWNCIKLKADLKKKGLSTLGNKAELIKRLTAFYVTDIEEDDEDDEPPTKMQKIDEDHSSPQKKSSKPSAKVVEDDEEINNSSSSDEEESKEKKKAAPKKSIVPLKLSSSITVDIDEDILNSSSDEEEVEEEPVKKGVRGRKRAPRKTISKQTKKTATKAKVVEEKKSPVRRGRKARK